MSKIDVLSGIEALRMRVEFGFVTANTSDAPNRYVKFHDNAGSPTFYGHTWEECFEQYIGALRDNAWAAQDAATGYQIALQKVLDAVGVKE